MIGMMMYRTPRERYQHDGAYNQLVNVIQNQLETCQFTPSEVREAAILACILYEERRMPRPLIVPPGPEVEAALKTINEFVEGEKNNG